MQFVSCFFFEFVNNIISKQLFLIKYFGFRLPPTTTTTLSPFAAEQLRLQQEYAERPLVEQQTAALQRSQGQRPLTQPRPTQLQAQTPSFTQREPLRFLNQNGQVLQKDIFPKQQDFVQQPQDFAPQTQDFAPQPQQNFGPTQSNEPFSYAQVQFGPVPADQPEQPVIIRPKGQRSVSRPRTNQPVLDPLVQQTIDHPATSFPVPFSPRLLQNVVYIQPNGQIHKPIEDSEPVVEIPRKNRFYTQASQTTSATTPTPIATTAFVAPANLAEEEPVIVIPRPKKPNSQNLENARKPGKPQQEPRKSGRTQQQQQQQQQQHQQQQHQQQQHLRQQQQQLQVQQTVQQQPIKIESSSQQQSSEVEPDNFLSSLLYRLQQQQEDLQQQQQQQEELQQQQQQYQQQQEHAVTTTTASVPKQRGGQRSRGGHRPDNASKYLPDRSQLQLLQFPHELHTLSSAELKVLEAGAGAEIAAANDQYVAQKRLPKKRPVAVSSTTKSPVRSSFSKLFDGRQSTSTKLFNGQRPSSAELFDGHQPSDAVQFDGHQPSTEELYDGPRSFVAGNRPVPTPVELNDQQRQFLATQGIRNLYRVDYDQSGNVLPLTYVLALDNHPKRAEQLLPTQPPSATTSDPTESS